MDLFRSVTGRRHGTPDDGQDTIAEPPRGFDDTVSGAEADGPGADARPPGAHAQAPSGPAESMPTIGRIGRYALKSSLGRGGLGAVYAAHDPLLSRLIAIKTVRVDSETPEAFEAAVLDEARAAAQLSHPHIVTVFDAGVSDHGPYIAMELLKGRDLRQLREDGWRPTPEQAATIVRRVADALGYAHSKGVVHRDVKPANIFMVGRTQPRVLDFGIASVAHRGPAPAPVDVAALGSPYYMSPEQARGELTDRRTDVFSLGVVFYELLCGAKPFRGRTLAEIRHAVLHHDPPPPHTLDRHVPSALSAIVARALEKEPHRRYPSARRMARELRQWLEEHAQQEEGGDFGQAVPRGGATERPRLRVPLIGAAALAVAVAAGSWWLGRASAPASPSLALQGEPLALGPAAPDTGAADTGAAGAADDLDAPAAALAAAVTAALLDTPAPAPDAGPRVDTRAPAAGLDPEAPGASAAAAAASATALPGEPARAAEDRGPAPRTDRRRTPAGAATATPAPGASAAAGMPGVGIVRLAVSPWGQIEVDGRPAGVTPPLTQLELKPGRHTITLRNSDFPAHTVTVTVDGREPVTLRHRF